MLAVAHFHVLTTVLCSLSLTLLRCTTECYNVQLLLVLLSVRFYDGGSTVLECPLPLTSSWCSLSLSAHTSKVLRLKPIIVVPLFTQFYDQIVRYHSFTIKVLASTNRPAIEELAITLSTMIVLVVTHTSTDRVPTNCHSILRSFQLKCLISQGLPISHFSSMAYKDQLLLLHLCYTVLSLWLYD